MFPCFAIGRQEGSAAKGAESGHAVRNTPCLCIGAEDALQIGRVAGADGRRTKRTDFESHTIFFVPFVPGLQETVLVVHFTRI